MAALLYHSVSKKKKKQPRKRGLCAVQGACLKSERRQADSDIIELAVTDPLANAKLI